MNMSAVYRRPYALRGRDAWRYEYSVGVCIVGYSIAPHQAHERYRSCQHSANQINASCIQQDCGDGLVKTVVQPFLPGQDIKQADGNHPASGFMFPLPSNQECGDACNSAVARRHGDGRTFRF